MIVIINNTHAINNLLFALRKFHKNAQMHIIIIDKNPNTTP